MITNRMTNKICLVTGANAGIGKATALGLAKTGATVVIVARSRERGAAAQAKIKQESGNQAVDLLLADLSSQADIRQLAAEVKRDYPALHVLINNAGIIPRQRQETEDGLEMQFAVNHLAYFLLTNLLLEQLKASAPTRIINVTSGLHRSGQIDFDDLQSKRSYRPQSVYAMTKLCNVLFTLELARRLAGTDVTANCLHPGMIATKLQQDYTGAARSAGASPERGAETPLYLATSGEVAGVSGQYFENKRAVPASTTAQDEALAKRLWQISAKLTRFNSE